MTEAAPRPTRGRPRIRPVTEAGAPMPTTPERPELRAEMRPEPRAQARADDPRARAAARAKALMESQDFDAPEEDKFAAPSPPAGWSYEWKTKTVLNAANPSYDVALAKMGWEAVPLSRHPELMPRDWKGETISRDGMILMERPAEITKRVRDRDDREARGRIKGLRARLGETQKGQFERPLVKVATSYEAPPAIPE